MRGSRSARPGLGRRDLLRLGGLTALAATLPACSGLGSVEAFEDSPQAAFTEASPPPVRTPDEALARLRAGNARYVAAKATHPRQSPDRRQEVAAGQTPYALILSCADSRVPPEIVFDEGLGDLFVVRSAGQVLDDSVVGSIQYAVEHLHVPLVMVLGHEKCGAVTAAVEAVEEDADETGTDIDALVSAIVPAVRQAEEDEAEDVLDTAVRLNIENIVAELRGEEILAEAIEEGKLAVVGARYALSTGEVAPHLPEKS